MKSIQLLSALFPLNSQPKIERPKELLSCFSSNSQALRLGNLQRQCGRFSQPQTKAIHTSAHEFALALASPPAKSPEEISAFVAISVVLFFMYWLSNFIAPELISKHYEFDKVNENQKRKDDDKNDDEDDYDDDDDDFES